LSWANAGFESAEKMMDAASAVFRKKAKLFRRFRSVIIIILNGV